MKIYELITKQTINKPIPEVFSFFARPENLAVITPKKLDFRILTPSPINMEKGTVIDYTIKLIFFRVHWRTLITSYDPIHTFTDEQIKGPYLFWHHTHNFKQKDHGVEITDRVRYAIPFGMLGRLVHWLWIRHDLKHIFEYRTSVIENLFSSEKYKLYTSDMNQGAVA